MGKGELFKNGNLDDIFGFEARDTSSLSKLFIKPTIEIFSLK